MNQNNFCNNPMMNNNMMNNPMMNNSMMNNPMMNNPMMNNNMMNNQMMNNPMMNNNMMGNNMSNLMGMMAMNMMMAKMMIDINNLNQQMNQMQQNQMSNQQYNISNFKSPEGQLTVFFRKNEDDEQTSPPIAILCKPDEKVSDLIKRYREKTGDFDETEKFIFNAKTLNPSLKVCEQGIEDLSRILVVVPMKIIG